MEGSVAIDVLGDLETEGWREEYENLRGQMKLCERRFVEDPYPYGSELMIDQTAHQQVYFFTRFFGDRRKNLKTVQVIKALRGGNQPIWFRYGNDKRDDVACWYTESLNGMALLKSFEESGDMDAFVKGYAGVMSVMSNVLPDGMGFNFFICTAGIADHVPPRTFENGTGQWGFMKAAKAYVIRDEAFGTIGCGCRVAVVGDKVSVYPKDGLKKRIRFVEEGIDVEVAAGEAAQVGWDASVRGLLLDVRDSTGLVKTASLIVRGLEPGEYEVRYGGLSKRVTSKGDVRIDVPMMDAGNIAIQRA